MLSKYLTDDDKISLIVLRFCCHLRQKNFVAKVYNAHHSRQMGGMSGSNVTRKYTTPMSICNLSCTYQEHVGNFRARQSRHVCLI